MKKDKVLAIESEKKKVKQSEYDLLQILEKKIPVYLLKEKEGKIAGYSQIK